MREGERYKCADPQCGTEIQVTKGSPGSSSRSDDQKPRCACGSEMEVQGRGKTAGR
jgi:hypothetical protein